MQHRTSSYHELRTLNKWIGIYCLKQLWISGKQPGDVPGSLPSEGNIKISDMLEAMTLRFPKATPQGVAGLLPSFTIEFNQHARIEVLCKKYNARMHAPSESDQPLLQDIPI
eukprot:scaffold100183_cov22-Tisochrysis_lutea.AAC.1